MASSIIHMAVASEINKVIGRDNDKLLIGAIAPDISKLVGETKVRSHFLDNEEDDIPNMDRFLIKYRDKLDDDFVMGYYIHLYTDYLWFKYFIRNIYDKDLITKLDGTKVKCVGNMLTQYIYNDYTNLNIKVLDEYDMDLHIFYEKIPEFENIIEEIPMERLQLLLDKVSIIIENSKERKEYLFNIDDIKVFIERSVEYILSDIRRMNDMNDFVNYIINVRKANSNNSEYPHVEWAGCNLFNVKIGDLEDKKITFDELINKYKENKMVMDEFRFLIGELPFKMVSDSIANGSYDFKNAKDLIEEGFDGDY